MKRRDFLQVAAAAGLAVLAPARRARAEGRYDGPFWITVHAGGGWDPTSFCDPKGGAAGNRESVNQGFAPEEIGTVGAFPYAPVRLVTDLGEGGPYELYSAKRFFERVGSKVVVLNGLDTSTNNHETGTRVTWSGRSGEGYPSIGAFAASVGFAKTPVPMAFLSYGGYDVTAGAVPLTRAGNVDHLWRVAYPNRIDPRRAESSTYHSDETMARVADAHRARVARQLGASPLPVARRALGTLLASRTGDAGLSELSKHLPERLVSYDDFEDLKPVPGNRRGPLGGLEGFLRQGQLALAAFQAGIGVSASLQMGGFDTHSDHDAQHVPQLLRLLRGVEYLLEKGAELGLADRLFVLVGSDFGRTPFYNPGNGKDHWTVTSMLVSGPGIAGGRVIGATTPDYRPKSLDPKTLKESATGVRLKPEHVHVALRAKAGLDRADAAKQFPIAVEKLPLFG